MFCPDCGGETKGRLAITDPEELKEEREYCLTCEKFLDENARLPDEDRRSQVSVGSLRDDTLRSTETNPRALFRSL